MDDRSIRETPIGAALARLGRRPLVVSKTTPLRDVAVACEKQPEVHVISVVDDAGALAGLLRVAALCDHLFIHVSPEEFLHDIFGPGKIEEFGRFVHARVAADLMEEPASVSPADTVASAFQRMHDRGLEGLPVVDDQGKPLAYIDRLRLIALWLEAHPDPES